MKRKRSRKPYAKRWLSSVELPGASMLAQSGGFSSLIVEFIAGGSTTDGQAEGYTTLSGQYALKGYMLKFSTPPILGGSTVQWSATRGGIPAGTFHSGGGWTDYFSTPVSSPNTQTVYWRSDLGGTIADTYNIAANYLQAGDGAPMTATATVVTRQIAYDPLEIGNYRADVDMLQRAMIQIFFLASGRLSSYSIGRYTQDGDGYYTYVNGNQQFSPIAEEVSNYTQFAMNLAASKTVTLAYLQHMWESFSLVRAAGTFGQITSGHADYNTWVNNAVTASALTMPTGFTPSSADLINAHRWKEAESHIYHSYNIAGGSPLPYNRVDIGWATAGQGASQHIYTDAGLGFMKVQPYNRGTRNLYIAQENLTAGAAMIAANIAITAPYTAGGVPLPVNTRMWYTTFVYNAGLPPTTAPNVPETPAACRAYAAGTRVKRGADYADAIYGQLGLTPP